MKIFCSFSLLFFCFVCILLPLSVNAQKCESGVRCQPGSVMAHNPKHKPTTNGCGNAMISVSSSFDMTPCCDQHDICYDTCFADKVKCDKDFERCLNTFCKDAGNPDGCLQQSSMYVMGVSMFGCSSFQQSQRNACVCTRDSTRGEL